MRRSAFIIRNKAHHVVGVAFDEESAKKKARRKDWWYEEVPDAITEEAAVLWDHVKNVSK